MQETTTVKIKKCPYCFRKISNDEVGFLLRPDGARFLSPALNEVVAPKTDLSYLYFWNAMGVPEEQVDANRVYIDNQIMTELNQELTASGHELAVKHFDPDSFGYSFHVEEGAVTLYSNTMLCPYCHNELPQNFFRYDMLMIGLAGSVASGKTVYLSSLMMNSFDAMQAIRTTATGWKWRETRRGFCAGGSARNQPTKLSANQYFLRLLTGSANRSFIC